MATSPILAQPRTLRANPVVLQVAAELQRLYAAQPGYGVPFCRALSRVVDYAATATGIAYVPTTDTTFRVGSSSSAGRWCNVTPDDCSCAARGFWCWHRALVHLLMCDVLVPVDRRDQPLPPCPPASDDPPSAGVPQARV